LVGSYGFSFLSREEIKMTDPDQEAALLHADCDRLRRELINLLGRTCGDYEMTRIERELARETWMALLSFLAVIALVCALVCGVWVGVSALEARAFNAATGKSVTTWQAMFLELRIQEATSADAQK
jgi:hypothetical protein